VSVPLAQSTPTPAATEPPLNLSVAFGFLLFACAAVRASPSASTVMNPVIRRIR